MNYIAIIEKDREQFIAHLWNELGKEVGLGVFQDSLKVDAYCERMEAKVVSDCRRPDVGDCRDCEHWDDGAPTYTACQGCDDSITEDKGE